MSWLSKDNTQNCGEIRNQWYTSRQEKEIARLCIAHRLRPIQTPKDGRTNKRDDIPRQEQSLTAYETRNLKPKLKHHP